MKILDIALKDLIHDFRSAIGLVFMFGIPLLITGMFYFMFGPIAGQGDFSLPQTKVVIANLDEGGPKFQVSTKNIPGGVKAHTMGELVVSILQSEDLAELLVVSALPDAASAQAAVDDRQAQAAVIIPTDFSKQFADVYGEAVIEFYRDPTLTIAPGIVRSILNQFMDGMAGVKIAVNVAVEELGDSDPALIGQVIQEYMDTSLAQVEDPEETLLDVRTPQSGLTETEEKKSLLLGILTPIMGGIMVFYAFYTGMASAQSIINEEERRTLQRLFTTPTPQSVILSGKFLAVFMTVLVQVSALLAAARFIFGIQWGEPLPLALVALGIVLSASTFGIFANSFLKSSKQGGMVFGGVLTVTGIIGMIGVFAANSPTGQQLSRTVSLLVPQGWAVRGLMQVLENRPVGDVLLSSLALLLWSAVFFSVGVWRFNRRYA